MSKIRLNLAGLSIPEKLSKPRQIVIALTGNPNFPTPSPGLAAITTAANELEAAGQDGWSDPAMKIAP